MTPKITITQQLEKKGPPMSNSVSETSLSADIFRYIRYQLRGRRGLIVAATALGIPALWIGWPWLVVAGIAPLLIALAPCAIMCALGFCAMKAGTKANSSEAGSDVSASEPSCCSQAPATNELTAASPGKDETETAAPVKILVPAADLNSAKAASGPQIEEVGPPDETVKRGKEKV